MKKYFPSIEHVSRSWRVVPDDHIHRANTIQALLTEHIGSLEVLVEVNRKLGGFFTLAEAVPYIAGHIGKGEIRVADRQFSGFVVVACNGVAAGWRTTVNPIISAEASDGD